MATSHDGNVNAEATKTGCGIMFNFNSHSIFHLEALNFLHYRFRLNQALVACVP